MKKNKRNMTNAILSLVLIFSLACGIAPAIPAQAGTNVDGVEYDYNDDRILEAEATKKYVTMIKMQDTSQTYATSFVTFLYASDYPLFFSPTTSTSNYLPTIIKDGSIISLTSVANMEQYIEIPYMQSKTLSKSSPSVIHSGKHLLFINDSEAVYDNTYSPIVSCSLISPSKLPYITTTAPVFDSLESAQTYFETGDITGILNKGTWEENFTIEQYISEKHNPQTREFAAVSVGIVPDSLIGEGALLVVPARLDPVYDESAGIYQVTDYIAARGHIRPISEIVIKADTLLKYELENSNVEIPGQVKFGTVVNEKNTEIWSAAEVETGRFLASNATKKPITINIAEGDVPYFGNFDAILEIDACLGVIGMYRNLCDPTTTVKAVCNTVDNVSGIVAGQLTNPDNLEVWNLNNLTTEAEITAQKVLLSTAAEDTTVKQIELGTGEIYYGGDANLSDRNSVTSWIKGCKNLSLVVIPSGITANQLNAHWISNKSTIEKSDYTGTYFNNTTIEIGNALSFVKDIENSLYIYVPHIVYRGTKAEWQALSGSADWVFGNAANTVTVHCTDGTLTY